MLEQAAKEFLEAVEEFAAAYGEQEKLDLFDCEELVWGQCGECFGCRVCKTATELRKILARTAGFQKNGEQNALDFKTQIH